VTSTDGIRVRGQYLPLPKVMAATSPVSSMKTSLSQPTLVGMPTEISGRILEFLLSTSPQAHQTLCLDVQAHQALQIRSHRRRPTSDVLQFDYGVIVSAYQPHPILQVCRRLRYEAQDFLNKHAPTIIHANIFRRLERWLLNDSNIRHFHELHVVLGKENTGLHELASAMSSDEIMAKRLRVCLQDIEIPYFLGSYAYDEVRATLRSRNSKAQVQLIDKIIVPAYWAPFGNAVMPLNTLRLLRCEFTHINCECKLHFRLQIHKSSETAANETARMASYPTFHEQVTDTNTKQDVEIDCDTLQFTLQQDDLMLVVDMSDSRRLAQALLDRGFL
jgi:hypothetical protein